MPDPRTIVLLRATRDLLRKQVDSYWVLDLLAETVVYDGTDCDGSCLLDDIEAELDKHESERR